MKQVSILFSFCLGIAFPSAAQQSSSRLPTDLIQYFAGKWEGKGTFSNGKPIAATATFTMSLDSSWLQYEHKDIPPNRYKALSLWGTEKDGSLLAFIFDSFQGHRQFHGDYTRKDRLVLTNTEVNQAGRKAYQHFIYEKLSPATFKMAFEMSQDSIQWRTVDTLIFSKII